MSSGVFLKITVRPCVKAYIENKYGSGLDSLPKSDPDFFLRKLRSLLRPQPTMEGATEVIEMELPYSDEPIHDPRVYNYLSEKGATIMDKFVYEQIMMPDFFEFMNQAYQNRDDIKDLIEEWMDKNGLTEKDIDFETLKKRFYRFRESKIYNSKKTK